MAMTTTMTTTEKDLYQDASVVGAPAVSQGDPHEGREGQSLRGALTKKKSMNRKELIDLNVVSISTK